MVKLLSHGAFAACILVVLLGAACLRLPQLAARPMHADEANQAIKTGDLWDTGVYRYDVAEHHGPSLYWLTQPVLWLRGTESFAQTDEWDYRLVPVLFGLGLIALLPLVADGLGRGATVTAGILTAISPAMVFYSRYYVQEMLLVFFTFAAIASVWRYVRTRRIGWAIAAGAAFGFMHATKETWVLAAAAMAAALALSVAWARWRDGAAVNLGTLPRPAAILAAAGVAILVAAAFYSSFGKNWHGPWDSIRAYVNYCQRGSEGGIHSHAWYYYFELLLAFRPARGFFWTEGLIAALALIGAIVSLTLRQRGEEGPLVPSLALGRFLAFYTVVLTLLYAVIPYKTPWCLLSFLHGMILLGAVGAWALLQWMPGRVAKAIAFAVLAAAAVHLGRQAYALSFRFPADQRNPYVYAHATSDVLKLATQMERLALVSPEGHDMVIHVVTPENFWPLPWYLRQFNQDHIGYWQDPAVWREKTRQSPPPAVILLTADVQPDVDAALRGAYNQQMIYGLRPGVLLSVYVRDDLWQAFLKQQ